MNFDLLQKGALQLAVSLATTFNFSSAPPVSAPLQEPSIVESYNLPSEIIETPESIQDLNAITQDNEINLELVTKEIEETPLSQDVMLYTVVQPTPKPTVKPEEKKIEIIKEAQAEEVKEEQPSPSPSAIPTPSPTPSSTPAPLTGSNADQMFQMANNHRAKLGLQAFEKNEDLCKIAQDRAPQINGELASGALHAGFKTLNLPYWATENIAAYSSIEQNFNFWISDYIHRIAIEGSHKYSCVACSGSSCSQIFTSFVKK